MSLDAQEPCKICHWMPKSLVKYNAKRNSEAHGVIILGLLFILDTTTFSSKAFDPARKIISGITTILMTIVLKL
jgi:hypothetical protein